MTQSRPVTRKTPKRTRIATGIYQDRYGFLATVSLGGHPRAHRFPPQTTIAS